MSVDHSAAVKGGDAKFLHVRPGRFVIVGGGETLKDAHNHRAEVLSSV